MSRDTGDVKERNIILRNASCSVSIVCVCVRVRVCVRDQSRNSLHKTMSSGSHQWSGYKGGVEW